MLAAVVRVAGRVPVARAPCARLLGSAASGLPARVRIVEVGPRDGLQNEKRVVDTAVKVELIERLAEAGLPSVEATSFVSPKWVPQMADANEVLTSVKQRSGTWYPVLTPNMKGYQAAVAAGAKEVAVFAAASESFAKRNTGASIAENAERHRLVLEAAKADGVRVRGYVSCVLGCPYEGQISPDKVGRVTDLLLDMGCYEVSLGDTIGVGTPVSTDALLAFLTRNVGADKLALHFHNTYGTALANIMVGLRHGVSVVDSSVSGLGGCPYAKGATGNVATEDVVFVLHAMGVETGVDMDKLLDAGKFICDFLGIEARSNAANALLRKRGASEEGKDEKRG